MNTIKNILFFGLLLAVLGGVYLSLNRSPEPTLPPGLSGDTRPPKIDIPGLNAPITPVGPGLDSSSPPSFPAQPPIMSAPPANLGGTAPPFPGPALGNGPSSVAPPFTSGGGSALPNAPSTAAPPTPPATPPASIYPPGVKNPFDAAGPSASPPSPLRDTLSAPPPDRGSSTPPPADRARADLAPPASDRASSISLERVMQQVKLKVGENRLADALLILSQLYGSPDLAASQARETTLILDQMAATVIYSRAHYLESPYLVQAGDTLDMIADRYQVPALLLARINGIRDPQNLPPGKELKVLKGPFSAYISTDRSELTLMLSGRYAGRFNVVLSNDLSRAPSLCTVRDKRAPTAAVGSGAGKQWIELGNASGNISLQGTNDTRVTTSSGSRSTIWLSEQDMDDVFGILSVGSRVIIQR